MKKVFWAGVVLVFAGLVCWLVFDTCGNTSSDDVVPVDSTEVVDSVVTYRDVDTLDSFPVNFVEHSIALDKEYMYAKENHDYHWFETCVLLSGFLDEMTEFGVQGVANVFQEKTQGLVSVYLRCHTVSGADSMVVERNNFWVEDFDMTELDSITFISTEEAFNRVMASNYPKPHSAYVVLRREIGPVPNVMPQYIFGNNFGDNHPLYVDAVSGNVTDVNPTGVVH